eukprot:CAMPEP_0204523324 /NCGR_PEP_ID=MMETSP0661-20131031/6785_1 /ASSEMBLY_ACC=CAM_ASM_000606 /TAXON_ID=109239 /ORGANISM="Alexandrium margalefi, Strain AMGDE01CS-322" /LENGTH=263 /DNA_ID=CAMNT_0051529023 /DNA_START=258 /DNA_END=1049 /DNA_ORIENTATION=+
MKLDRFSFHSGFKIDLTSTTTCDNPNPYTVEIRSTEVGRVYMGEHKTLVASITEIPHSTLPAEGTGSIEAKLAIEPTLDMFPSLISGLAGAEVPIYIENMLEVVIDVDFLFGDFSTRRTFDKDCALNFRVEVFGRGAMVGPLVCGGDLARLRIPPASAPATGEVHVSAVGMARRDIDGATAARDAGLGAAMGVGFGLGALLPVLGACGLWWLCRRVQAADSAGELGDIAGRRRCGGAGGGMNATDKIAPTRLGAPAREAPERV